MKTPNQKSNRLTVTILALLCVALAGWVAQSRSEISSLQSAQADLQKKFDAEAKRTKAAAADSASWRKQTDSLMVQASDLQKEVAAPTDKSARKRNYTPDEMAALLKNPAMQNIIGSQQSAIIQMAYRDLLDRFKLSPEERDYMQKLLVEKQMTKVNLGMQFLNPNLTPQERGALGQQFQQGMQASESKIHEFLNDDADYTTYQAYSQQEPERTEIGMMEASLTGANDQLDATTSDALANVMIDTRKNFSFTVDFNDERNLGNPEVLNAPTISKFLEEQAQFQTQVAEKAAQVLSPTQLTAFKQNQASMMQMTRAKLGNILQMSGR